MIAPVRPSWKERYPLTAIERYIAWRREDGELLHPWMRLHERLGARVATALPRSMRLTGTIDDWQGWTGLAFPRIRRLRVPTRPDPRDHRLRR